MSKESNPVDKPLSVRDEAFVREFLLHADVEKAALAAGYSSSMAKSKAYQWVRPGKLNPKPHVYEAIRARREDLNERLNTRLQITRERILTEIARVALADPRRMFDEDGTPLRITELDDDAAAAIAGFEVMETRGKDDGAVSFVRKYKLVDKNSALDKLAKHLGLYEKDNDQSKPVVSVGLEFL